MAKTLRRVYMDFAAATPLSAVAQHAYVKALALFGNASAPHAEGRAARAAVTAARALISRTLSVKPDELTFTSGGTESNSLAILGHIRALHRGGKDYVDMHLVTTSVEHSSVQSACSIAAELGVRVSYVVPRHDGLVALDDVLKEVGPNTVMLSMHHVQSESGTVQRVPDIARAVKKKNSNTVVHIDAAQSPLWLDAGPHRLHADLVTYDAQKVMGPKGVGILYRDFSIPILPIMGGGTQERSLRPGTENVPAIVSAATAFVAAKEGREARVKNVTALRDRLAKKIVTAIPDVRIVGSMKRRVANNLFISIRGVDGDYLSVLMDKAGIAVTPRSACLGTGGAVSAVALALLGDELLAMGTLRFTLGPTLSISDIDRAVKALVDVLPVAKK